MTRFNALMTEAKAINAVCTTTQDFQQLYVCFGKLCAIAHIINDDLLYYARNTFEDAQDNAADDTLVDTAAYATVKECRLALKAIIKQAHKCYHIAGDTLEKAGINTLDKYGCIESYLLSEMLDTMREIN